MQPGSAALPPAVAAEVLARMRGAHGPVLPSREIDVLTGPSRAICADDMDVTPEVDGGHQAGTP
jgi:hypothetical protein